MELKYLTIKGYRGIHPEKPLVLKDFGHINVFIGKNNAGKSTALRFLHDLATLQSTGRFQELQFLWNDLIGAEWFWQQEESISIEAELHFKTNLTSSLSSESRLTNMFIVSSECRFQVLIRRTQNVQFGTSQLNQTLCIATPLVWIRNNWQPALLIDPAETNLQIVNTDGGYENPPPQHIHINPVPASKQKIPLIEPTKKILAEFSNWFTKLYFFDPVRSLDRPSSPLTTRNQNQNVIPQDGSALLNDLRSWQQDPTRAASFSRFIAGLQADLNRVFDIKFKPPSFKDPSPQTGLPDLHLQLEALGSVPISFRAMGTGVSQTIILLASLRKDEFQKVRNRVYCLEEPETNLHPTLLRRLMGRLREVKDAIFLVSTHSPILINDLSEHDSLHLFRQAEHGNCTADLCETLTHRHGILDQLGVAGSDLLQANCVIWVEGPSDRLYIRNWLNEYKKAKYSNQPDLLEGGDYTFIFFGGKLLSHYAADSEAEGDFIQMLFISRFSAIVMDKDQTPLKDSVSRIFQEAQKDNLRRLPIITRGKEIENDLPRKLFFRAVANYLDIPANKLDGCLLPDDKRYPDAITTHLGANENQKKTWQNKLKDKVVLAKKVLTESNSEDWKENFPEYIGQLYNLIRRAAVPNDSQNA